MKIIRAAELGMCFGVRDALQLTRQIANPTRVTSAGELVHSATDPRRFQAAGFHRLAQDQRQSPAPTPLVLLTAHGVNPMDQAGPPPTSLLSSL